MEMFYKRKISEWDKKDVNELLLYITNLKDYLLQSDYKIDDYVDLSDLPTENLDGVNTGYPAWALDKWGYVLTGECIDEFEVEKLSDIIAEQDENE